MELEKYKVCPTCGEHNKPASMECRWCETDLTGVRVVDSESEQFEAEQSSNDIGAEEKTEAGETPILVRVCEECGAENAPQARKCKQCGEDISDILPIPVIEHGVKAFSYLLQSVDGDFKAVMDKPFCIIGREAELKDYLIDKVYVSRQHAELNVIDRRVFIKNLSNTNKTFVNNIEISNEMPQALSAGDEIGLGGKQVDEERQERAAYFIFQEIA